MIAVGDTITDGLVNGVVTGEGSLKFGRKELPAYKIEIQTGGQKGIVSLIAKTDAQKVGTSEKGLMGAKEPWQMPQLFVNSQRGQEAFPLNVAVSTKTGKPVWTHSTTVQWDGAPRTFEITQGRSPMPPNIIARLHEKVIEAALSEGKPVPPEVLKDYPGLVKTTEETREQAKERIKGTMHRYHSGEMVRAVIQKVDDKTIPSGTSHLTDEQLRNRMIESQNRQIDQRAKELREHEGKPKGQSFEHAQVHPTVVKLTDSEEDIEANLEKAQLFHKRRKELAQQNDESQSHDRTIKPQNLTTKRLRAWKKRPGGSDIRGVDSKTIGRMR